MENWIWILAVVGLALLLFRRRGMKGWGSTGSPAAQGGSCGTEEADGTRREAVPDGPARVAYCPVCGREADGQIRQLGEAFCSETHAVEFAQEVRASAEARRSQQPHEGRS